MEDTVNYTVTSKDGLRSVTYEVRRDGNVNREVSELAAGDLSTRVVEVISIQEAEE